MPNQVEHRDASVEIEIARTHAKGVSSVAGVVEGDVARSSEPLPRVLRKLIRVAFARDNVCLQAERILVHAQKAGIGHELIGRARHDSDIAAQDERRGENAPHAEVGGLLVARQPGVAVRAERGLERAPVLPHLQHVEVVEVPWRGIGAQIEVLRDDVADRIPVCPDVARRAPGTGNVRRPCSGKGPPADVQPHIVAACRSNRRRDLAVSRLFLEVHVAGPAVVHLDEVKSQLVEMESAVGGIVSVQPRAKARLVATVAGAGVVACVGIGPRLHAQRMDAVHRSLHAVWKSRWIEPEPSVRSVSVEKPVVNVDVDVSGVLEAVCRHCLRNAEYDVFRYVLRERIPAGPSH